MNILDLFRRSAPEPQPDYAAVLARVESQLIVNNALLGQVRTAVEANNELLRGRSAVDRGAHNAQVVGSIPASATTSPPPNTGAGADRDRFTGAEIDTLRKLSRAFPNGVEDGDIPSKAGRDSLVDRGYCRRENGLNFCTPEGRAAELRNPPPPGSRAERARLAAESAATASPPADTGPAAERVDTSPGEQARSDAPVAAGDAQRSEPVDVDQHAAPNAPAATSTSYVVGGPHDGQSSSPAEPAPELPAAPSAPEEAATSAAVSSLNLEPAAEPRAEPPALSGKLPKFGTGTRRLYDALQGIARATSTLPSDADLARRAEIQRSSLHGMLAQLQKVGLITTGWEGDVRTIHVASLDATLRRAPLSADEQAIADHIAAKGVTVCPPKFVAPTDHGAIPEAEAAERIKAIKLPEPAPAKTTHRFGPKASKPLPPS